MGFNYANHRKNLPAGSFNFCAHDDEFALGLFYWCYSLTPMPLDCGKGVKAICF
jgi:hypothetical protein